MLINETTAPKMVMRYLKILEECFYNVDASSNLQRRLEKWEAESGYLYDSAEWLVALNVKQLKRFFVCDGENTILAVRNHFAQNTDIYSKTSDFEMRYFLLELDQIEEMQNKYFSKTNEED